MTCLPLTFCDFFLRLACFCSGKSSGAFWPIVTMTSLERGILNREEEEGPVVRRNEVVLWTPTRGMLLAVASGDLIMFKAVTEARELCLWMPGRGARWSLLSDPGATPLRFSMPGAALSALGSGSGVGLVPV